MHFYCFLLPSIKKSKILRDLACSLPSSVVICRIGNKHDRVGTARTKLTVCSIFLLLFFSTHSYHTVNVSLFVKGKMANQEVERLIILFYFC